MQRIAAVLVVLVGGTAVAAPKADDAKKGVRPLITAILSTGGEVAADTKLPRFAITYDDVTDGPGDYPSMRYPTRLPFESGLAHDALGVSADGKSAWLAADYVIVTACASHPLDSTGDLDHYAPDYCHTDDAKAWAHLGALFELAGGAWQPVAWHLGGRQQGGNGGVPLADIEAKVEPAATDAVAAFRAGLADPKVLLASVADRPDVALLGSERGERYRGQKEVRATLAKWNLKLAVHDGLRAGTTASASAAWVLCNLDATPKSGKTAIYRALFVYEHAAAGWQLVQATFSDAGAPPKR